MSANARGYADGAILYKKKREVQKREEVLKIRTSASYEVFRVCTSTHVSGMW